MTIYNAGEFLEPAINSLLAQSFTNFELIAIENGSTDDSRNAIKSYDDKRFKILEFDKNIGRTPALNVALKKSCGEFIAILDADDIFSPEKLKQQVNYLKNHRNVVLLGTQYNFINEESKIIGLFKPPHEPDEVYQSLTYTNNIAHSSAMYRCNVARKVGGYPKKYTFAQDLGLWIAMARFGDIAVLPETLTYIRKHKDSATESDVYLLSKSYDLIQAFREASMLPGLKPSNIIRSYKTISAECIRYSILLMKSAQIIDSIKWAVAAILTYVSLLPKLVKLKKSY